MVQMKLFTGQEERRRHREQTWNYWKGGDGMNWEINIDI